MDDTPTSLDLVRSVLAAEGFATLAANNNGREARELALSRQPDLILMDVVLMPGETGFRNLRTLEIGTFPRPIFPSFSPLLWTT